MDQPSLFERLFQTVYRARQIYWHVAEPTVVGVRALIIQDGRVMLVRHTYLRGWYLPGGKVDRGETALTAVRREVHEECSLEVQHAVLRGVYANVEYNRNDHILLYTVESFRPAPVPWSRLRQLEIAEARFFDLSSVPDETTPATRRRLDEHQRGRFDDTHW